jgi:hypothetical protein
MSRINACLLTTRALIKDDWQSAAVGKYIGREIVSLSTLTGPSAELRPGSGTSFLPMEQLSLPDLRIMFLPVQDLESSVLLIVRYFSEDCLNLAVGGLLSVWTPFSSNFT